MKYIKLPLKIKISVLVSFLLLILFILSSYIITSYQKNLLTQNLQQKGKSLIDNFALFFENNSITGDELNLIDYVDSLLESDKDRIIKDIYIIKKDGTYYFHSKSNMLGKKHQRPKIIRMDLNSAHAIIKKNKETVYQFYKPVYEMTRQGKKKYIGEAYLELTTSLIKKKISRIAAILRLIFIILFILGIIGALLISTFLVKPIRTLVQGINIIGRGNLKHKIMVHSKDEVEDLAVEFNKMTRQLSAFQNKLIKQKVIEQELSIAKNIQSQILPSVAQKIGHYNIINFHQTSSVIGGDYYNLIPINKNTCLLVIGDVSGKGIPAALLMAMFHTMLITLKEFYLKPLKLMQEINLTMSTLLKKGHFITCLFALLDIKNDQIKIVSAGHEYPVLLQSQKQHLQFIKTTGIPIGLMDNNSFESKLSVSSHKIKKDELLLFFTDGLRNLTGKPLNNRGLEKFFNSLLEISKKTIIFKQLLLEKVKLKIYHDDLTLLGVYKEK